MEKYKQELMDKEYNYIYKKYFNNSRVEKELTKMKTRPASKGDALVNGKPYTLYKYDIGEVLLVPKVHSLFKGDFDNVYELGGAQNIGMHFSIMNKRDGIINCIDYNFLVNGLAFKEDYVQVLLSLITIDDPENDLYNDYKDKNVTFEQYLAGKGVLRLGLPRETSIVEIHKHEDGRVERCNYPKLEELYKLYSGSRFKFKTIDLDKEKPLISVVEDIIEEKSLVKAKKLNK